MNDIIVSVAMITYGHEKYIKQALDSILMQKVDFRYEIIIGEDSSPDNTKEILLQYKEKYPDIIKLILRGQNVGASRNIYDVWRNCKGKYIATLEGDDFWIDEKKLQKSVDFLDFHSEFIGVSHVIEARNSEGTVMGRHPGRNIAGKEITVNEFLRGQYYSAVATMFRNIFLNQKNDLDIIWKGHYIVADYTLCLVLLDYGRIFILEDCMSVYRVRNSKGELNYNSTSDFMKQYFDHISLINVNNEFYSGKYDFTYEYTSRSALAFLHALRRSKLKEFYKIFSIIPKHNKVKVYLIFPLEVIKYIIKHDFNKK